MPAESTLGTAVAPVPVAAGDDLASLEAGLDALETERRARQPRWRRVLGRVGPPVVALVLVLLVWQLVAWSGLKSRYAFPWPVDVWDALYDSAVSGRLADAVWGSVSRAVFGFAASVVIGTPIGLLVARVRPVRTALKPVLSGLQSLPSVAWVPVAIIWFGLTPATIYFVVLMGAVPSIANGTVAGIDQVPPLFQRVGRVLGAQGLRLARHVLLPAALPGYLAGLRQGWAFAWRSLMAAELIAVSPKLGSGLGQELEQGRLLFDMPLMLGMIVCILAVGVAIELLFFAPVERRILRRRGLLLDA